MLHITQENQSELIIHIQNQQPIEVLDFTQSMASFALEYNHHAKTDDFKLYIKEVKSGSIIATLVAIAPTLLPFAEHTNSIIEFATHLKNAFERLKGKPNNATLDATTLNNLSKLVEPVAKDKGATLNIHTVNIYGDVKDSFNVSSLDANAIQNNARRELESLKEPIATYQNKVVLYFSQARGDNKKGDKGIIELISKKEVKVAFGSQAIKNRMIIDVDYNIFDRAYLVDVKMQTVNDKPVLYTITEFYETIELGD
ncbi:hypothetical protein LU276_06580 [Moraxella haemolytica]|uniref:hypothetical protein n=1 Tax=Moraxella haemolytica TaxID=2904119 RepID=UPI0025439BCF|nr:hypothetical protein [Moraxella sp. ZY171148]WII94690.1 hypothetical protein LU276_06580 [Moraxella sp. ZY171148]